MDVEKLATQKEVRRKLELENAITTGSVLNRAELEKVMAAIADAFCQSGEVGPGIKSSGGGGSAEGVVELAVGTRGYRCAPNPTPAR